MSHSCWYLIVFCVDLCLQNTEGGRCSTSCWFNPMYSVGRDAVNSLSHTEAVNKATSLMSSRDKGTVRVLLVPFLPYFFVFVCFCFFEGGRGGGCFGGFFWFVSLFSIFFCAVDVCISEKICPTKWVGSLEGAGVVLVCFLGFFSVLLMFVFLKESALQSELDPGISVLNS